MQCALICTGDRSHNSLCLLEIRRWGEWKLNYHKINSNNAIRQQYMEIGEHKMGCLSVGSQKRLLCRRDLYSDRKQDLKAG